MSEICSFIDLHFYNVNGTRRNTVLPDARGISFTDELAGEGRADYQASLLAQALAADPDVLEDGVCKAAMVLQSGQPPVEVFFWELVPTSGTVIGDAGRDVQASAPGIRHLLEYGLVHSEGGPWDKTTEDERHFGWMSKRNTYWYDAGDWTTPLSHGFVRLLKNGEGAQKITPDLTPAVNDVYLFRSEITFTTSAPVLIHWQADDEATLYVDSEVADTTTSANTTQSFVLGMTGPRTHTIAAEVRNTLGAQAGLTLMMVNLTTGTVVRRTDTTAWTTHKVVGGVYPGQSPGAIIRTLLNEANSTDQDVYAVDMFTPDFDGATDSNGDAWPELHDAFRLTSGSDTLGDAVRKLEEMGCDVRVQPDGTLQAFISQGLDKSATCWFQEGVNLLGLSYNGTPVQGTKGVIRTGGGWLTRTAASVSTWGKRYFAVVSGSSGSTTEGARLVDRALEETASPRYTYSAVLRAVNGCVPFFDFGVGDLVTCLDRKGDMVVMRVLAITAATPDDSPGPVSFTVELDVP